jgi:hypothetical protein
MDVWSGYLAVRGHLVRSYFQTPWIVATSVLLGLLSLLLNPLLWNLLSGSAGSLLEFAAAGFQILLAGVIVTLILFLISLLLTPTVKVWGGNLIGKPEIEACALLMWDPQHKYWRNPARRRLFWRQAPHPYPMSVYTDPVKLAQIEGLAITDSSSAWGQATVLSIFVGIGIALISTLLSLNLWTPLVWQWQVSIAGLTIMSFFLAVMSALVANAAATIAQTITLLNVEALQRESRRNQSTSRRHFSPWL